MKRKFDLEEQFHTDKGYTANIIGSAKNGDLPYVSFSNPEGVNIAYIKDKDLERFAINILKAVGSDKIKDS